MEPLGCKLCISIAAPFVFRWLRRFGPPPPVLAAPFIPFVLAEARPVLVALRFPWLLKFCSFFSFASIAFALSRASLISSLCLLLYIFSTIFCCLRYKVSLFLFFAKWFQSLRSREYSKIKAAETLVTK